MSKFTANPIDVAYVLQNFTANFETGLVYTFRGEPVGEITYNGSTRYRVYVKVQGKNVPIHRLIWVLYNEIDVPAGLDIKHINKNQMDNRMINLSVSSRTGSLKNSHTWRDTIGDLIDKAEATIGEPLPYKNVDRYRNRKAPTTLALPGIRAKMLSEALQYHIDNDTYSDGFTEVLENVVDELR